MHTVMAESGLEKASQDRRSNSRKRVGLLQMVNLGAENGGQDDEINRSQRCECG